MITVAQTTTVTKYIQIAVSVIVLGLSARVLGTRNTLSTTADALSEFNITNNGTSLTFDNTWHAAAAAVSAAAFTLGSSLFNYFYPSVVLRYFKKTDEAITFGTTFTTYQYMELPLKKFSNSSPFQVSKFYTSYLTTLLGSEGLSNVFWFVNMLVQVSGFGSNKCNSVSGLLNAYNVTGISESQTMMNFFNIFDNSSTKTDIYNDLFNALQDTNYTSLPQIPLNDLNGTTLQTSLLLAMSQNCQIKKASMGMTVVQWVTQAFSSGLLTTEFFNYYKRFINLRVQAHEILALQNGSKEKTMYRVNDEGSFVTFEEENIDNDDDDSEQGSVQPEESNARIFLVLDHHWGLFKIYMKRFREKGEEEKEV